MAEPPGDIFQRKRDHLALTHTGPVGHGAHRGLFEEVALFHDALPELALSEIDLRTPFLDHTLAAPLMLTGMTGGPPEAGEINRDLARVCGELGLAFGVGSQRIITKAAESLATFRVRDAAPDVVLLGNLGVMQARQLGVARVRELFAAIEADYLAIHLNPAMELVQPGADADSDFRDGYETIARVVEALEGKVLVKECGSGIGPRVAARLMAAGVRAIDVSGSGGTSWVKVEALRAAGPQQKLGLELADWGIPTAAATVLARRAVGDGTLLVASGGIDGGLTAAKALALGADVAGVARAALQAYMGSGIEGAREWLSGVVGGIRSVLALTGCKTPEELRLQPRVVGPTLRAWLDAGALPPPSP